MEDTPGYLGRLKLHKYQGLGVDQHIYQDVQDAIRGALPARAPIALISRTKLLDSFMEEYKEIQPTYIWMQWIVHLHMESVEILNIYLWNIHNFVTGTQDHEQICVCSPVTLIPQR